MLKLFLKLKKELIEQSQRLESQILESNYFNILKERYQSLAILKQKLIKICLIGFLVAVALYLPFYYLSSSTIDWFNIKEKHRLSLELLKVREKSSFSKIQNSSEIIKNKINQVVQKYSPEKFTVNQELKKFPKSEFIEQILFKVKIPYLNIKRAIQLGTELENLDQVRLDELNFTENKNYEKHYDVYYQLSAFVVKKKAKPKPRKTRQRKVKRTATKKDWDNKKKGDTKKRNKKKGDKGKLDKGKLDKETIDKGKLDKEKLDKETIDKGKLINTKRINKRQESQFDLNSRIKKLESSTLRDNLPAALSRRDFKLNTKEQAIKNKFHLDQNRKLEKTIETKEK